MKNKKEKTVQIKQKKTSIGERKRQRICWKLKNKGVTIENEIDTDKIMQSLSKMFMRSKWS